MECLQGPTAAVVGGVVANAIVRAISKVGAPLRNFFFYSPADGQGMVEDLVGLSNTAWRGDAQSLFLQPCIWPRHGGRSCGTIQYCVKGRCTVSFFTALYMAKAWWKILWDYPVLREGAMRNLFFTALSSTAWRVDAQSLFLQPCIQPRHGGRSCGTIQYCVKGWCAISFLIDLYMAKGGRYFNSLHCVRRVVVKKEKERA